MSEQRASRDPGQLVVSAHPGIRQAASAARCAAARGRSGGGACRCARGRNPIPGRPLIAEFLPLYEAVVERADMRLTSLSPAFFEGLCQAPVQAALITCRQGDRMIGGLVCVSSSERCVSFRIGLDYEVVRAHNVWFVLQYEAVRLAIERGCRQLNLLQSTYPAKLELGAHLDAPAHHLAHRSAPVSAVLGPLLARILRAGVDAALCGTAR